MHTQPLLDLNLPDRSNFAGPDDITIFLSKNKPTFPYFCFMYTVPRKDI